MARARRLLGMLWLASGLLFFPATALSAVGDVISFFPTPGPNPFGLTFDGTNLWHADRNTATIYEITRTGTIVSSFPAPGPNPEGLAWDGTNLWLADDVTGLIYELTTTGTVLSSFPAPGPNPLGLTFDGTNLWLVDDSTGTIYELTTTGTVLSSIPAPGPNPKGLTWDGANLWVTDASTDTVYEVTTTGIVLSSFAAPATNPRGLTFDGTDFWLADKDTDLIYQLEGPDCSTGVVTTTADRASGRSLRGCIIWANGNPGTDTLTVPAGTYTLTIAGTGEDAAATGDLDITDGTVINGDALGSTIIDANAIDRVFEILGASATFSNLTIRNGNVTGPGGGIKLDATASLTLSASTVSGNTSTGDGGGIRTLGGTVDLTNVTLSGNAAAEGGGLTCNGPCTLTNVTVTATTAPAEGVLQKSGGSITFLNTIVANNGGADCTGPPAALISNGNNLSSDASCDFTSVGDQENTNPLLGPLQDNGGPTFTHELLTGSPAIEAGTNTGCPATDQRGVARPIGATCDIGAFEAALPALMLTKTAFWADGTPIPTGATIPSGVVFKYLIYINNRNAAVSDVSVRDVLDPAFQYQAGSIQVDNSVAQCAAAICTPAEEQAIFAAVAAAAFLTDAADGDVASYTGASSSIDAGNGNVANLQLDINANAVWALLFSVKMP
ncbi:MAG: choice-of-anchor Q domain-containing protein [Woeseia sp.]